MTSRCRRLFQPAAAAAIALTIALAGSPARAGLVTVSGTTFDLRYDDSRLGLFGAPALAGDQLFFTFSSLSAESANGAGTRSADSAVAGIELLAHSGFRIGTLAVSVFGDYNLLGAGSRVSVQGTMGAFDLADPSRTASAMLSLSAATPLDLADGANHDWLAQATIADPFGSGSAALGLSLTSRLGAETPAGAGPRQAFIEQKFAGVALSITSFAVPEPGSLGLAAGALAAAMVLLRRGRQRQATA